MHGCRAHGSAVCGAAQRSAGAGPARDLCAAELRLGCRSPAKSDPFGGRCSILLPLRPTGYAPAERNSILLTFNVPRWARLNRRSGPNQLAKSIETAVSAPTVIEETDIELPD